MHGDTWLFYVVFLQKMCLLTAFVRTHVLSYICRQTSTTALTMPGDIETRWHWVSYPSGRPLCIQIKSKRGSIAPWHLNNKLSISSRGKYKCFEHWQYFQNVMSQTNSWQGCGLTEVEQWCFDREETHSLTLCVNIGSGSGCDPHF